MYIITLCSSLFLLGPGFRRLISHGLNVLLVLLFQGIKLHAEAGLGGAKETSVCFLRRCICDTIP